MFALSRNAYEMLPGPNTWSRHRLSSDQFPDVTATHSSAGVRIERTRYTG